jgi:hypothetical protein
MIVKGRGGGKVEGKVFIQWTPTLFFGFWKKKV